ncbi:MAG: YraN family protein [Bacteroidetes Order II. Incertae sedis bacterium]|nr:YraN family protein [Bacteroidetes Order II. bacterium]
MGNKQTGDQGEEVAEAFLHKKGFQILHRNYRVGHLELDLVCRSPDALFLVFVEVKTRRTVQFGHPAEAIGSVKRDRLIRAAELYLHLHRLEETRCRFDVVSIVMQKGQAVQIEHYEDAFWAN